MEITFILSLLPVIYGEYQEAELIQQLTDYFNFDHHFFLLDPTVDANRFLNANGLTPQTLYVRNEVKVEIKIEDFGEMESKNGLMIVASQTSEFEHTSILLDAIKAIQFVNKKRMKIGMFFPLSSSVEDLHKLFEFCMDNQITDTFAAIYPDAVQRSSSDSPLNTFTFNSFGTVVVINVTSSETFDDYFQSVDANFHHHQLRFGGKVRSDTDGHFWRTVFRLINATFIEIDNINISEVKAMKERVVDLFEEVYVQEYLPNLNIYPMKMKEYVILVPEALPYSVFSAYLQNGLSGSLLIYSIISTVASILLLIVLRYIQQKRILVLQSVADVLNLLMNDNGYIKYQKLVRSEVFIIVPLTFVGFIAVNGIISSLQSHLTSPVLQPQINTVEDIYSATFPINTHGKYWKSMLIKIFSNQRNSTDWDQRIIVTDYGIRNYMEVYDREMSSLVGSDIANLLLKTQKQLKIKGYHQTDIYVTTFYLSYLLHDRFLFFDRLNDIVHRLKSTGLYELWMRRDLAKQKKRILKENAERLRSYEGPSIERIEFPMLIVYGWFVGIGVFVLEITWMKIQKKVENFVKLTCGRMKRRA